MAYLGVECRIPLVDVDDGEDRLVLLVVLLTDLWVIEWGANERANKRARVCVSKINDQI